MIIKSFCSAQITRKLSKLKPRKAQSTCSWKIETIDQQFTNSLKLKTILKFRLSSKKACSKRPKALLRALNSLKRSTPKSARSMLMTYISRRKSLIKHLYSTWRPSDTLILAMWFKDILKFNSFQIWSNTWRSWSRPLRFRLRAFRTWTLSGIITKIIRLCFSIVTLKWSKKTRYPSLLRNQSHRTMENQSLILIPLLRFVGNKKKLSIKQRH